MKPVDICCKPHTNECSCNDPIGKGKKASKSRFCVATTAKKKYETDMWANLHPAHALHTHGQYNVT